MSASNIVHAGFLSTLRNNHIWKLEDLQIPLPRYLEQLIKSIPVAQLSSLSNSFIWSYNKAICLASSASKLLYHQTNVPLNKSMWNWIWKIPCPNKLQFFIWKSMRDRLPTRQYLAFSGLTVSDRCPRCNNLETTVHILRDCPWAKEIWLQSPSILPLSFFQLPLQPWLKTNSTSDNILPRHKLPWKVLFSFLCWHLWLARNEHIFHNQSSSQPRLFHKAVQLATKYFYLVCPTKTTKIGIPRIIKWITPLKPFIKLNTNGSSLSNPGLARAGGLLQNCSSSWVSGFSLRVRLGTAYLVETKKKI